MKLKSILTAVALSAACFAPSVTGVANAGKVADSRAPLTSWVQVQGSAMYLARIGLLPGSKLEILVEDADRADAAAPAIARRIIPIRTTPARFAIRIPRVAAGDGNTLNLRLTIRDRGGMAWISDRHIAFSADPFSNYIDVGEITLVSAR